MHADGWRIDGCPHAGPGLAVDAAGRLHAAWYTGVEGRAGLYHAVSDDGGKTWYASEPLLGFGAIQPTVLRRDSGELVAYMRENGVEQRIRVASSQDDGLTWGEVTPTNLPNPGSGLDGIRMTVVTPSGRFALRSPLIGEHNVMNLLTAVSVGLAVGLAPDAIAAALGGVGAVAGRFEQVKAGQDFLVVVDYAHTPDARRTEPRVIGGGASAGTRMMNSPPGATTVM